jgi:gluconolactonase
VKNTTVLSLPLFLAALMALAVPAPPASIAENLAAAKFTHYAKAPGYSEGPSWVNGDVFFCSDGLRRVDKAGNVALWLDIGPAGTVLRGDGHLLICDNKHKALLSLAPDGTLGVLADSFEGRPLNSLNDLTVDARGNIYWTDPGGSSLANPVGGIFRLRPDGVVSRIGNTFAFPNGLDVDPAGQFLQLIESQSKKILRFRVPADDQPLGASELFYDLGGSGGDGCAFDAAGNLWVADFQRPETKQGRITVLSPEGKLLGQIDVPAQVVSNITFGGPDNDEIFCTTGTPAGVFHAKVGVKGFTGHPGVAMKTIRTIAVQPSEGAHPLHPRRFGVPGNIGISRGWYVWRKFDPATWTVEVQNESSGEIFTSRVLPWATTYRHLYYDAHVDELLPGERVNCFFNPDGDKRRGWLVHYQDEICQMKGHGHAWVIQSVKPGGREFSAQVFAGDKQFEEKPREFELAADARIVRGTEPGADVALQKGDRLYFTWTLTGDRRVVRTVADDAGLEVLKKEEAARVDARLAREGLGSFVESVDGETVHLLIFSSAWFHANQLKAGQTVGLRATTPTFTPTGDAIEAEILTRKNLGTYGSGASELTLRLKNPADGKTLSAWSRGQVISTAIR